MEYSEKTSSSQDTYSDEGNIPPQKRKRRKAETGSRVKRKRRAVRHDIDTPFITTSPGQADFLIPCSTSDWNSCHLESLRIYFENAPKPISVLLDKVYQNTGMFGPLNEEQSSDGKLWTADRIILRDHEVISEADVAITSVGTDQEEFDDISALVSIVEIDNHDNLISINIKQQEIKSLSKLASDSSDSLVSEGPVLDMPPICNWISSNVLGQHGGELLIHFDKFAGILTQKEFFYRPGMILFGTKVVFTLLVCSKKHWMEITDTDSVKKGTSFISYSEPKDLLIKKDRDELVESIARLNNIC
ncbi:uncharacterized protein LOC143065155 isoform X5 [Mytilus galloprovincialis]|uniref:uncharacterized protein LOC143065155 isoform X5 n=1 Tax=Mytilus galloprovincialis TaxID=29158 RepID=UPI003F7B89BD